MKKLYTFFERLSNGKLTILFLFFSVFFGQNVSAQVDVVASAGTLNASYTNLSAACTAINAGTHQGTIIVNLNSSFTDAATSVLNSSGAGSASYTSVVIRPTVDNVVMSFASLTGRGVIELNGADNVTIDGDNPNTGGTNRNLTITNTAANTVTYTSVVRIALSTLITTADNVIVNNCILNGNATGRNVGAATSTTGSEHTTYGILVGGNASTVAATTAPSAVTSVSATIAAPITANAFTANNNLIDACARGISVNGSAVTVVPNLVVNNNIIGSATAGNTTTVYSRGMSLQGFSNATISGNTVRNMEWFVGTAQQGIALGDVSATGNNAILQNNTVLGVNNRNTGTFGAYGINLAAGNNNIVRNNFVGGITGDMTGGGAFSTTFGIFGIRVATGTGHSIYYNTVSLSGLRFGTATTTLLGASLAIVNTGQTGCDVRNNILSNTMSGGTTGLSYVSLYLPTGGTSAMNLTLNNNFYYCGSTSASQGIAQVGATSTVASLYLPGNFIPGATAPATNLRSYTSTLSAAGTNDNLSAVSTSAAPFVSATNLHIDTIASNISDVDAKAVVIGSVTTDFDGNTRDVSTPDIGADEFTPPVSPGILQFSSATYSGSEGSTLVVTVNRNGGSSGAVDVNYTLSNGTAIGTAACGVGTDYVNNGVQTVSFANGEITKTFNVSLCSDLVIDPLETFTIALSGPTGGATLGAQTNTTVTIGDIAPPFNGTYTVGTSGIYSSLTNAGGIFEALNLSGASGNITINIISDLVGETGTFGLNELSGGYTTLIQPLGAPRTITGSINGALIKINGADGVTINGSTTGATVAACLVGGNAALRELTVQNTNVGTSSAVISVQSGTNGAMNNVIKNVNVIGQDPTTTLLGIALGGNTPGTTGTDNDNNIIENCSVQKSIFGIYSAGLSLANQNSGTIIRQNDLSATGTNRIRRVGIALFNENNANVSFNNIGGIDNAGETADAIGIALGIQNVVNTATTAGGVTNTLVTNNKINGATNDNTYSASGIAVAGDVGGPNTISNNMISNIISDGNSGDLVAGIFVAGATGSNTRLYNNTVDMTGDRSALLTPGTAMYPSYGVAITGTDPTVDMRNNILNISQTAAVGANPDAKSFAVGTASTAFVNLNSNYNNYFSTGAQDGGFRTGSLATAAGTNYATLALWAVAVADDANSVEIAPVFVSATDLHLVAASNLSLDNLGTPIATVTTDYDCAVRSLTTPDMGADEFCSPTTTVTNITACDTYTWAVNSTVYTTSGAYNYIVGCHTETLNLTINITPNADAPSNVSVCDSYILPALTVGNYFTGPNGTGTALSAGNVISSTATIYVYAQTGTVPNCTDENSFTVTITPSSSLPTEVVSVCDTYTWSANGTVYTTSGIYTSTTSCVTRTLDLTITPSSSLPTEVVSVCDTYTWSANGTVYTTSGIYTSTTSCVTRTLDLTITTSSSLPTEVVSVCDTYTWSANGTVYTTSGIYTSTTNCVTRTLDLTITTSSSLPTEVVSVCDTYTWSANGTVYTTSGIYTSTTSCVTRTLDLTITTSSSLPTEVVSVCDTYTWSANGTVYTTSGIYTSTTNCVTRTLDLTITTSSSLPTEVVSVCDTYTWSANGTVYTTSGIYTSTTNCITRTLDLTITVATISGSTTQILNGGVASDVTIEDIVVTSNGTVTWFASSADATANINPLPAGTQLVDGNIYYGVTNIGPCRSTTLAVTITVVLGTSSFDLSQLNYYPNPVKDIFNVKYTKEIISVDVYDLTGRKVIEMKPNTLEVQLNMTNLSSAMYIVKLRSVDGITELKVYKN